MIRLDQAHQVNQGIRVDNGQPVVIAVLDTGIDRNHPAFAGRLVPGYDFVDGDDDTTEEGTLHVNEGTGHGTHVAGIVALTAPQAKIMPIRVLDEDGVGELWRIKDAIIFAANHGADIVNISFGFPDEPELLKDILHNCDHSVPPPPGTQTFPELLNNITVLSGAGNGGDTRPIYPAGRRIDAQLGVGASTRFDKLASFSTMNDGDVSGNQRFIRAVAPGEDIVSALPGGRYGVWSGTSMAAPIASGLAALVKALNPTLAPHLIGERLEDTGIEWECFHPVRGIEIDTSRVDAFCAVTNNQQCGINPFACSQAAQRSPAMLASPSGFEQFLKN